MNRKSLILIAFCLLLITIPTNVLAYEVSVSPIKNTGYPGESLSYKIYFINNKNYSDTVRFNVLQWDLRSNELRLDLSPGEEESTTFDLTIPKNVRANGALVPLYTWSGETDETQEVLLRAKVKAREAEEEKKFFLREVSWPKKIDPREEFPIKVTLETRSNKVKDMGVRYELSREGKNILVREQKGDLLPQRNTTVSLEAKLPDKTEPMSLPQRVDFFVNGTLISSQEESLKVKGYKDVEVDKSERSTFLGKEVKYAVTNNGTIKAEKTITEKVSFFEKLFLSTKEGEIKEKKVVFDMEIQPEGKKSVGYRANYTPLLVVPFILIGVGYGVYYFTRKAKLQKKLIGKKTEGEFEAKIEISFKNLANEPLKKVKIVEPLPPFVNKVGGFGTLKPEVKEGKKLVWKIGKIEKDEERVLSYKAKSGMGIVGRAIFKPARASFKHKGKEGKVYSKKLTISSRPEIEEEEV